ncbi:MAG: flagellar hook-basal body complex protein FliE [Rhodobacteraceae bacterium]|nr:flagellar hook-basal body complex protein FliE [Paracoccaceae bacterium]
MDVVKNLAGLLAGTAPASRGAGPGAGAAARPAPGEGAGTPLGALASSFAETLAAGEQAATAALLDRGDTHVLVQAITASQIAVETAVAVRDRVVEAYQEILRMPV